jgi:hypothetical protein
MRPAGTDQSEGARKKGHTLMSQRTDTSVVLAETVRAACLDAATLAYEDAGIRGLCAEGRWEAALAAMRQLDLVAALDRRPAVPISTDGTGTARAPFVTPPARPR